MATKTTKKTTTRKAPAKKTAASENKLYKVMNAGTPTDYKTKYHVMCVFTLVFAVLCGVLFWAYCNEQSNFEDFQNCVAEDKNCPVPNKRADKKNNNDSTSYYDGGTAEENAADIAGGE